MRFSSLLIKINKFDAFSQKKSPRDEPQGDFNHILFLFLGVRMAFTAHRTAGTAASAGRDALFLILYQLQNDKQDNEEEQDGDGDSAEVVYEKINDSLHFDLFIT